MYSPNHYRIEKNIFPTWHMFSLNYNTFIFIAFTPKRLKQVFENLKFAVGYFNARRAIGTITNSQDESIEPNICNSRTRDIFTSVLSTHSKYKS